MVDNYPKAYQEVLEILKYISKENVKKIPQEMINTFNTRKDDTYNFHIDINKSFSEQKLLEETKAILANIFKDYWATPYQKEIIQSIEKYEWLKVEEEKKKKYNNDIFKSSSKYNEEYIKQQKNSTSNKNLPIEVERKSFFENIIDFFKHIFK